MKMKFHLSQLAWEEIARLDNEKINLKILGLLKNLNLWDYGEINFFFKLSKDYLGSITFIIYWIVVVVVFK